MKYAVSLITCVCMVYVCSIRSSEGQDRPPKLERDPSLTGHKSYPGLQNSPTSQPHPHISITDDGDDDFCVVTSEKRTPSATSINSPHCPPNSPNLLTVIVTPAMTPKTSPARQNGPSSHNTPAITPAPTPSPFPAEAQDPEHKQPEQSPDTLALQVQAVLETSGANNTLTKTGVPSPKQSCLKCLRCCLPCCWPKTKKR